MLKDTLWITKLHLRLKFFLFFQCSETPISFQRFQIFATFVTHFCDFGPNHFSDHFHHATHKRHSSECQCDCGICANEFGGSAFRLRNANDHGLWECALCETFAVLLFSAEFGRREGRTFYFLCDSSFGCYRPCDGSTVPQSRWTRNGSRSAVLLPQRTLVQWVFTCAVGIALDSQVRLRFQFPFLRRKRCAFFSERSVHSANANEQTLWQRSQFDGTFADHSDCLFRSELSQNETLHEENGKVKIKRECWITRTTTETLKTQINGKLQRTVSANGTLFFAFQFAESAVRVGEFLRGTAQQHSGRLLFLRGELAAHFGSAAEVPGGPRPLRFLPLLFQVHCQILLFGSDLQPSSHLLALRVLCLCVIGTAAQFAVHWHRHSLCVIGFHNRHSALQRAIRNCAELSERFVHALRFGSENDCAALPFLFSQFFAFQYSLFMCLLHFSFALCYHFHCSHANSKNLSKKLNFIKHIIESERRSLLNVRLKHNVSETFLNEEQRDCFDEFKKFKLFNFPI